MARKKTTEHWEQTSLLDEQGVVTAPPALVKSPPELKGSVRKRDHITSINAARTAKEISSKLKQQIIVALRLHGAMTDEQLESLPQFAEYGDTTVRKRRTELTQMKKPMVRWNYDKRPHSKTGQMMKVWEYCGPR